MGTTVVTDAIALVPVLGDADVVEPDTYTLDEIGMMVENLRKRFSVLESQLVAVSEGLNAVGLMQNQVNEMVQGFTQQASAAMNGGGLGSLLKMAMGSKGGAPNGG